MVDWGCCVCPEIFKKEREEGDAAAFVAFVSKLKQQVANFERDFASFKEEGQQALADLPFFEQPDFTMPEAPAGPVPDLRKANAELQKVDSGRPDTLTEVIRNAALARSPKQHKYSALSHAQLDSAIATRRAELLALNARQKLVPAPLAVQVPDAIIANKFKQIKYPKHYDTLQRAALQQHVSTNPGSSLPQVQQDLQKVQERRSVVEAAAQQIVKEAAAKRDSSPIRVGFQFCNNANAKTVKFNRKYWTGDMPQYAVQSTVSHFVRNQPISIMSLVNLKLQFGNEVRPAQAYCKVY